MTRDSPATGVLLLSMSSGNRISMKGLLEFNPVAVVAQIGPRLSVASDRPRRSGQTAPCLYALCASKFPVLRHGHGQFAAMLPDEEEIKILRRFLRTSVPWSSRPPQWKARHTMWPGPCDHAQ